MREFFLWLTALAVFLGLAAEPLAQSVPGSIGKERIITIPGTAENNTSVTLHPQQLAPLRNTELPTKIDPAPDAAAPLPELPLTLFNMRALYSFNWNGLSLGDMFIDAEEGNGQYRMRVDINASGIAAVLNSIQSRTTVIGKFLMGESYYPKTYETIYISRKKTKYIRVEYGDNRTFKEQYNNPKRGPRKEDFPDELKSGAFDPLSAVFEIRRALYQALKEKKKTFKVSMYDGRRLADLYFVILGEARKSTIPAWELTAERYPIAGYSEDEQKEMVGEPQMHIFFSRDELMLPLAMTVSAYLGTIEGKFVRECATVEACMGNETSSITMPKQDVPPQ